MTVRGADIDPKGYMTYKPGWKDLLTSMSAAKVAGTNEPSWVQIRDGIYGYEFNDTQIKDVWVNFHIPHDYAPNTDLYPHVHYVPLTDEVEGVIRWGFEYIYADREGDFPAAQTIYVEETIAANSQYKHIVSESSDADAIKGDHGAVEVDGVLLVRVFRDATHANDTYVGHVAGIFADIHYLSDRDSTLNKVAPFRE